MSTTLVIQICAFALFGYIMLYGLIDRICKCKEHCASIKSIGSAAAFNPDIVKKVLEQQQQSKR